MKALAANRQKIVAFSEAACGTMKVHRAKPNIVTARVAFLPTYSRISSVTMSPGNSARVVHRSST